jgi:gas vesicle structural protein
MRRHARRKRPGTLKSPMPMGLDEVDVSLLDVIDHVLNQGIVLSGELTLGVADVDLIYVRLLALVCSADRALSYGAAPATSPLKAERRRA